MTETVKAKYKASIPGKSSIEIEHGTLPLDLNKLIVWVMTMPEEAMALVPEYERIRGADMNSCKRCGKVDPSDSHYCTTRELSEAALLEALEEVERLCAERGEAVAIKPTHLIYVGGQGMTRDEFQEKAQKLIDEDCQE